MKRIVTLAVVMVLVASGAGAVRSGAAARGASHSAAVADTAHAGAHVPPGHAALGAPPLPAGASGKAPHPAHPNMKMPNYPHYGAKPVHIASALKVETVTLYVFHRVFANFHDRVEARPEKPFRIGDSDYTGQVFEFVPDFSMDLKTHRVTSRSDEPRNVAFHIIVRKKGVPQDTTWAFLDMPPHFARKSLVAFLATNVTFANHPPIASKDSLATRLAGLGR